MKIICKILVLSFLIITLFASCDSPASPKASEAEFVKPDIWCELNFKLEIKANPQSENELKEVEGSGFRIIAKSYSVNHDLGIIRMGDPSEAIKKEWNNIDHFKTGDKEYRFELSYMDHSDPNPAITILSKDTYNIELQISIAPMAFDESVIPGVLVLPESFSTTWSCGLGDRKALKFLLSRE